MKLDLKEQYRRNSLALKEARLSPRRKFLLRLLPFVGILLFLTGMFSDFYEWGDGDISAVSSAIWQLNMSDKRMVQITEQPVKYLTLPKYVDSGALIETMEQDDWVYLGGYLFERNGETIRVEVQFEGRDFAILRFEMEQ